MKNDFYKRIFMDNIEFTLEMNAKDSFEEALNFFNKSKENSHKIRITILLLDNFLELFLKKYISHAHPLLIYQKPSGNDLKTLTLQESVNVIKKIDYELEDVFERSIVSLRKFRNELQHHEAKLNFDEWEVKIGEIIYYAFRFDKHNNNLFNIEAKISPNTRGEINHLKDAFEKYMDSSINEATNATYYDPNDDPPINPQPLCPICGIDGTTHIKEERRSAYCHFCRDSFPIRHCSRCGMEKGLDEFPEDEESNISTECNDCWDDIMKD